MNKHLYPLLIAQFLSAFADNAVLFTVIAIVMQSMHTESWYIPAVQSAFTVAYVMLAPWVGEIADTHAKPKVLLVANLIKAGGAALLLLNVEPILAYSVIGMGAAVYNPVKYGILPELADYDHLIKANSLMEGSTILAILLGMMAGAKIADYSTHWALVACVSLFIISALVTLFLPTGEIKKAVSGSKILAFGREIRQFFTLSGSSFAIMGGGLFWLAAATLRVILIAWAPLVLMTQNATEIAALTLFLAIGIIIGSAIVPRLIPLEHIRRARIPAYLMALSVVALSFTDSLWSARAALLLIGMMGGMFIVPVNAILQELGKESIGSGRAVALQGFFNNIAMLVGVGCYTFAAANSAGPVIAMMVLGLLIFVGTFLVSLSLRHSPAKPHS
ncbi:MAG: lysophospholipid transporter LplT [Methylovulum sp.]|uniref:lysophospholipid transporter LplT n=1 Tax=Methylovulum sp. TaxID=1916980 RepID=UPI002617596A|nr:lysophospholipid transporter LplT [Methylovulum sp.]MDD2722686.1 lysophospholipid transporter LplT [Methylovulum sp.]MDD5124225.1 lysophospholipid transporter LplT [Methylovulum sp.]